MMVTRVTRSIFGCESCERAAPSTHMSRMSVLALLALALARGDAAPSRRLQSVAPSWTVDTSLHEDTMTLVAIVRVQDVVQATGTLGAFSGGDTRGVSILSLRIPRGPHAGEYCFMLMVYGLAGDTITFRFWDGQTITDMIETERFVPGSIAFAHGLPKAAVCAAGRARRCRAGDAADRTMRACPQANR